MNKVITLLCIIIVSSSTIYSNGYVSGSVYGYGSTKIEAYASALGRVPGNGVVVSIGYNGFSSTTYDGKKTFGKYRCTIIWKKFNGF